ncbi:MAG: SGNH/GDSL hydrolase family protein [Planctomycetes bacterium]|nr:SGNH/GDSL hydrolase family protein [Planctomycetota bacterium]
MPARRPTWKKLLLSLALGVGFAVVCVELLSRRADAVLAARSAEAGYRPPSDAAQFDLWDRLAFLTLEYGSPKRGLEQTGARSEPHPYLGYALVANYRSAPHASQQVSHNSLGFRGKETSWEKPPGTYRIVTTGGSSVYGQSESSDAAVWSQRLEDMLQAARPGTRIEVVNLGVSGWSSHEMLVNLALRGLDLSPDLVIVYEAINDMRCALYTPGGPVQRDNTHWRQAWPIDRPSRLEQALSASRTYLVLRRWATDYAAERVDLGFFAIRNYKVDFAGLDPYLHAPAPQPALGFANTRRNLRGIVTLARSRGAEVLFATQALPRWHLDRHPSRGDQVAGFEHVLAIQREIAAELAVPLVESGAAVEASCEAEVSARIEEALRAAPDRARAEIEAEWRRPGRRDLLFFQEVHPNDRGSELVARTIADHLLAAPFFPR